MNIIRKSNLRTDYSNSNKHLPDFKIKYKINNYPEIKFEHRKGVNMTELIYYEDQYVKEIEATVENVQGNKVLFNKTIFFPQTSTEPGDLGKIGNKKISGLKKEGNEVWHIFNKNAQMNIGDTVKLELDWDKRYKAMRLHAALHMFAGIMDMKFGERAVAGAVKPDLTHAYLVFKHKLSDEVVDQALNDAIQEIENGSEIETYWDDVKEGFRWCKVGNFLPIPCGGLHVKNTKEIKSLKISKRDFDGSKEKIFMEIDN
jgi:alanyl-tRNA synthetase